MEGWIKLHRKMLDNPTVFKDGDYLSVWIWLLLNAESESRYRIFAGEKVELKEGQLIFTLKRISDELKISVSKVNRILKNFESEKQIEKRTCSKNTVITILNWGSYQKSEKQNEKPVKNQNGKNEAEKYTKNRSIIEVQNLFEKLLKEFKGNGGLYKVSDVCKEKIFEIGYEEMSRAIARYEKEYDADKDWRTHQSIGTFFTSGYIDYLDCNYKEHKSKRKSKNQFNDFPQNDYDFKKLEDEIISN